MLLHSLQVIESLLRHFHRTGKPTGIDSSFRANRRDDHGRTDLPIERTPLTAPGPWPQFEQGRRSPNPTRVGEGELGAERLKLLYRMVHSAAFWSWQ